MDLSKHLDYFDPLNMVDAPIHIIGCGAIGSTVAEMLTRMGITHLNLYDFDEVNKHNIANQMFEVHHIGHSKIRAMVTILTDINPDIELKCFNKGWTGQVLSGYVFLCVDNIDLRRKICEENKYNNSIKAVFDFRMRLTDAQHYAADWSNEKLKNNLIQSMQFTHDEAKAETPVSACGTTLNVVTTVRIIVSLGLSNFINFIKTGKIKKMMQIDTENYIFDIF